MGRKRVPSKGFSMAIAAGLGLGALLLGSVGLQAPQAGATGASLVTYTATTSIPTPPQLAYAGTASGDGWAVAVSPTQVFNIFHHSSTLQVACHNQADASSCWAGPEIIVDGSGNNFATSSGPGMYLNPTTGFLYVFAVRTPDNTAGVVCINTTLGVSATGAQRFCGFTQLSTVGDAPIFQKAGISAPILVGNNWFAFNEVPGPYSGTENQMLCFNIVTDTACPAQPYSFDLGGVTIAPFVSAAQMGQAGSHLMVQVIGSTDKLTCFDTTTLTTCGGGWPIVIGGFGGAPFPLLSPTGSITGICLPIVGTPCYGFDGSHATAPTDLSAAIGANSPDNGAALVLGSRVYVPDARSNTIDCFDFSVAEACTHFPKPVSNLDSLYTVNSDPNRPGCMWTNADHGADQIQSIDGYTGGACQGSTRVLSSALVAPFPVCRPANYLKIQVTSPLPNTYSSGSVSIENSNAAPLPGVAAQALSASGAVSLAPLNLTRLTPLPQFVITLNGASPVPTQIQVSLSWSGTLAASCTSGGQTVSGGGGTSTLGYWETASDGGVFAFGGVGFYGSAGNLVLNKPVVGMAATPDGKGYWLVATDGGIFAYGDATFHGSTGGLVLNKPVVGMAATPDGKGYWLVASDGGIFAFGDAAFHGSTGNLVLNKPVVGMAATPDGKGYWLVASDGGIFAFGDAAFHGSASGVVLGRPVVGMTSTPDGRGYWLVSGGGAVLNYGDAQFFGSATSLHLNKPIVGMARTPDGLGYTLVASDGGIFTYGDAIYYGSAGNIVLNKPIVGMST
jgi:hypothetical protein